LARQRKGNASRFFREAFFTSLQETPHAALAECGEDVIHTQKPLTNVMVYLIIVVKNLHRRVSMSRYGMTLLLAGFIAFLSLLFFWASSAGQPSTERVLLGPFQWSVIAAFSLYAIVSVWGMIGVVLSDLKKRTAESAGQDIVISRKSWHYRFNTLMNNGKPFHARSECEYWARIFHGFSILPPIFMISYLLLVVVVMVGWLFSARTNWKVLYDLTKKQEFFSAGHQRVGPIVLAAMMVAAFVLSGLPVSIASLPWSVIGKWAGMIIGGFAGAALLGYIGWHIGTKVVWPALRPLGSVATARVLGVCRLVKFVD
jgi:hypothetical protein